MSFETNKRKIRGVWEDSEGNNIALEAAQRVQVNKESRILLSIPNITVFNQIRSLNTEWFPMLPLGVDENEVYTDRGVAFAVEMSLPEQLIPYARLNVAYRRIGNEDLFTGTTITLTQFCQTFDIIKKDQFGLPVITEVQNLKRVIWNVGFTQNKNVTPPVWYDYEIKLFFSLINPLIFTAS